MLRKKQDRNSQTSWARDMFGSEQYAELDCSRMPHTEFISGYKSESDQQTATWTNDLFNSAKDTYHNPKIVIISGIDKSVREVEFNHGNEEFVLGNHPLADIQLNNAKVSRFHARIFCKGKQYYIEDLGSEQGTFLDGKRLQAREVYTMNAGSSIRIMAYQIHLFLSAQGISADADSPPNIENRLSGFDKPEKAATNPICTYYIENPEQIINWRQGVTQLTVVDIIEETHDVKTFRLAGKIPLAFVYQPGQFITLILTIDGCRVRRSYSMSSTPSRPYTLDITVKRVAGGLVSNWLCDELNAGDVLTVKGPAGTFSCFHQPLDKLLLIGAGSGITPIMSMARWIMDTGADVEVDLLASFHSERDLIFRNELELMATRCNNIRSAVTISSDDEAMDGWTGYTGRINNKLLQKFSPDFINRHIYLCGPEAFMAAVKNMLGELNFPMENLHSESFSSGHVEQGQHIEILKQELSQNAKYQLVLDKTGSTIPANDKFSILELAEMHGIEMDYSCRLGHCGECMVKCLSGEVEMGDEAEINPTDREQGWVYGCCTYPRSDIVLDL